MTHDSLWQVLPTGAFYKCRAAVAGRGAATAEQKLLEALRDDSQDGRGTPARQRLAELTVNEALELAARIVRDTLSDDPCRFLACTCVKGEWTWCSKERVRELVQSTTTS